MKSAVLHWPRSLARALFVTSACALVLTLPVTHVAMAAPPVAAPVPPAVVSVPPAQFPQARIDAVDTTAWPHVRILATVLDATGRPASTKALKKLAVVDGKKQAAPPFVLYRQGKPDEAHKDAKLQTRDKAGVPLAAMVVVAGYQNESLRNGTLGSRLKEALAAGWKQFAAGDRVNVLWYGDRLYRSHALKGQLAALDDVETRQEACQTALAEARAGGDLSLAPPEDKDHPAPAPGTWLCGLQDDVKRPAAQLKAATFKGHFPRLFGLGAPVYDVKRYCAPPPEDLEGFGPFDARNVARQDEIRERDRLAGKPVAFATSALDEALATLLLDTRPGEEPVLLLVSDGKDGYFRELELCEAHPPKSCQGIADAAKLRACVTGVLDQRIAATQAEFKARAVHWLGLLRAAGIRVFAVGLGALGRDDELERLRLLAERSGGTWRLAAGEDNVGPEVLAMMAELSGQLVLDFDVAQDVAEERPATLNLALDVELDPSQARVKVRNDDGTSGEPRTKLRTPNRQAPVPVALTWQERATAWLHGKLVWLQETLGYRTYELLGWALAIVGSVLVLLLVGLGVRAVVRRVRARKQQGG